MTAEQKLQPVHSDEVLQEEILKPMGLRQNRLELDTGVLTLKINDIVLGK